VQRWGERFPDVQGNDLQLMSVYLLSEFATPAELRAAWSEIARGREAAGWDWRQPGDTLVIFEALVLGDLETAVDNFVNHRMTRPISRSLTIHVRNPAAVFQPLYDDARVSAALSERQRVFDLTRDEVLAMLQRDEWTDP
jgi:hypothetical protein